MTPTDAGVEPRAAACEATADGMPTSAEERAEQRHDPQEDPAEPSHSSSSNNPTTSGLVDGLKAGEGLKTRDFAKQLHSKHLDYIQKMINKKKDSEEQKLQEARRKQKLKGKLAKQVLGEAHERLKAPGVWVGRATSVPTPGAAAAAGVAGGAADSDGERAGGEGELGAQREGGEGSGAEAAAAPAAGTRLPAISDAGGAGGGAGGGGGRAGRTPMRHKAPPRERRATSPGPDSPSRTAAAGPPIGVLSHLTNRQVKEEQMVALHKLYGSSSSAATEFIQWRVRHRVPDSAKVFVMAGSGAHSAGIRQGLLNRGWVENTDHNSLYFDLKWAVSSSEIDFKALWPGQVVNHFGKATCITTKVGLCRTVRHLAWYESADFLHFYPRGYDLLDEEDRAAFIADARQCAAEAVLKRAVVDGVVEGGLVDQAALKIALRACLLRLAAKRSLIDDVEEAEAEGEGASARTGSGGAESDGEALQKTGGRARRKSGDGGAARRQGKGGGPRTPRRMRGGGEASEDEGPHQEGNGVPPETGGDAVTAPGPAGPAAVHLAEELVSEPPAPLARPALTASDVARWGTTQGSQVQGGAALLEAARQVLDALAALQVQTHIDGMNNVWIVKPAGKSRGRGIRLFNNLDQLFTYIKGEDAMELEVRWVAQKYVERPLIIRQRKFDIRQWVLVTDWNPLEVWFYQECYLRFCADDYDPNNLDIFLHLSNNSVAKYYTGKKDDDITAAGNMWTVRQFKQWLGETFGDPGLWETLIQPAMKHIVVCTTKCAQDMVNARRQSCQLYGYDFLIDDQLRVWLLEINSSPTMEASTAITTDLCADVQEDILKVIVDLPAEQHQRAADGRPKLLPQKFDTGKYECIVGGGDEVKAPTYTGVSLELKGQAIVSPLHSQAPARPLIPTCYVQHSQALQQQQQAQQAQQAQQSSSPSHQTGGHGLSPGPSRSPQRARPRRLPPRPEAGSAWAEAGTSQPESSPARPQAGCHQGQGQARGASHRSGGKQAAGGRHGTLPVVPGAEAAPGEEEQGGGVVPWGHDSGQGREAGSAEQEGDSWHGSWGRGSFDRSSQPQATVSAPTLTRSGRRASGSDDRHAAGAVCPAQEPAHVPSSVPVPAGLAALPPLNLDPAASSSSPLRASGAGPRSGSGPLSSARGSGNTGNGPAVQAGEAAVQQQYSPLATRTSGAFASSSFYGAEAEAYSGDFRDRDRASLGMQGGGGGGDIGGLFGLAILGAGMAGTAASAAAAGLRSSQAQLLPGPQAQLARSRSLLTSRSLVGLPTGGVTAGQSLALVQGQMGQASGGAPVLMPLGGSGIGGSGPAVPNGAGAGPAVSAKHALFQEYTAASLGGGGAGARGGGAATAAAAGGAKGGSKEAA